MALNSRNSALLFVRNNHGGLKKRLYMPQYMTATLESGTLPISPPDIFLLFPITACGLDTSPLVVRIMVILILVFNLLKCHINKNRDSTHMSTFNTKETIMAGGKNVNFDRQLYRLTPEWELYTTVVNTLGLEGTFYETGNERLRRIRKLVAICDHRFTAKLAVYARQQMNLRTIPIILIVELAAIHRGDSLVSKTVEKCILRADEITELLACYQWHNKRGNLKGVSAQLTKGLRTAFNRFDEYQFAKYSLNFKCRPGSKKDKKMVTLRDALFLVHPKAKDEQQQQIFNRIARDELQTPYTWEYKKAELQKRQFRSFKEKLDAELEMWEEMLDSGRLGYMAIVRNIKRMYELAITDGMVDKVCEQLLDKDRMLKSRIMPIRLFIAIQEFGNYRLEKALTLLADKIHRKTRFHRYRTDLILRRKVRKKIKYRIEYRCTENDKKLRKLLSEMKGEIFEERPTYTVYSNRKRCVLIRKTRNLPKIHRLLRREQKSWKKYRQKISLFRRGNANDPVSEKAYRLIDALWSAFFSTSTQIKGFDDNTRVLIAGGMSREMSKRPVSKGSVLTLRHISAFLSYFLAIRCGNVLLGRLTTKFTPFPLCQTASGPQEIDENIKRNWDLTSDQEPANGLGVLKWMTRKREARDKIFIFTDGQILFGSMFTEQWKKYKRLVNPNAKLYIFDLGGYGTTPVKAEDNDVFTIAGWNNSVFEILEKLEEGESALKQIKSIKL